MTYFNIGSLTIPAVWIAVALALAIADVLNRVILGSKVGDWYWNGFFIYFLTWKLSYIFFNLKMFLNLPFSIVYYNGCTKGHILAIAILTLYLALIAVKKYPAIYRDAARIYLFYFISYEIIRNALNRNTAEVIFQLILLAGYVSFLFYLHKKNQAFSSQMLMIIILLDLLIISLFRSIFSIEIITFLWIGLITFILLRKKKGEKNFE